MNHRRIIAPGLALAALVALAAPAAAHDYGYQGGPYGPPPVPGYGMPPGAVYGYGWHDDYGPWDMPEAMRDRMHHRHSPAARKARAAEWMDYVREELDIQPGQEKAWNAFADAVKERAAMPRERFRSDADDPLDRQIEHLEQRIERTQAYLKQVRNIKAARDALFKVLTDDQRRTADELLDRLG